VGLEVGVRQHHQTYVKVAGKWCYLYRAIDGNLVDVYLSETRDIAKAFLRSAKSITQVEPEQVTTDGHTSYPKAIAEELGTDVRTSQYKNNVTAQVPQPIDKWMYFSGQSIQKSHFGPASRPISVLEGIGDPCFSMGYRRLGYLGSYKTT
jgi:transposase-like protein